MAEFENLLVAFNVTDNNRQRALLLYYAGNDVHEIYRCLLGETDTDEDFDAAKSKPTNYFEPKVNLTYEIFHFRETKQVVSNGKTNQGVSNGKTNQGVFNGKTNQGVFNGKTNQGVSNGKTKQGVSNGKTKQGVSNGKTKQGVSNGKTKQGVSNGKTKQGVSNGKTKQGVSNGKTKQGVSNGKTKQGVSNGKTKQGVSNGKTKQGVSNGKTKQGVSNGQESVGEDEPVDAFVTRLRKKAKRYNFTAIDNEIKYQVLFGCSSTRLQHLQKDDLTLKDLIDKGPRSSKKIA